MNSDQTNEITLRDRQAIHYENDFIRTRGFFGYKAQIYSTLMHLNVKPSDSVADLGCGIGIYSMEIARLVHKVYAVDFSSESIRTLELRCKERKISNIETQVSDITTCCLPDKKIDKVLLNEVIQHVPTITKRHQTLVKAYDCLKSGGCVLMIVYRYGGWIKPPKPKEEINHRNSGLYRLAFTADECFRMMKSAGFVKIRCYGILTLPTVLRKRLPASLAWLDAIVSKFQISRYVGKYLLVKAEKI